MTHRSTEQMGPYADSCYDNNYENLKNVSTRSVGSLTTLMGPGVTGGGGYGAS